MVFPVQTLPVTKPQIYLLLETVQQLWNHPFSAVSIQLEGYDDPQEIFLMRGNDGYEMILSFPMDDFEWPHPLLLKGPILEYGDVKRILVAILLHKSPTDSLAIVMEEFRDITSDYY